MVLERPTLWILVLSLAVVVSACGVEDPSALQLPEIDSLAPTSTPAPSPAPQRVLSICLGEEPRSLFIYGDQSTSARIIRQAIYDGPVDKVNFQSYPVMLAEIPDQENGLVSKTAVEVLPGQRIVDARGNITFLASGTEYRPVGCESQDCWEVYSGQPAVEMDRVEIQYRMVPDQTWADGKPVLPEDSIFSYQIASQVYGSAGPAQLRYTANYSLGEDGELIWQGLPGYQGIYSYADFFFHPLPQHQLENLTREEILTAPQTNLQPLGWGAYRVLDWVQGDHITLVPNPNYLYASEGLPAFDALVFRFVESGEESLAAFRSGECQILANVPDLISYQSQLLQDQEAEQLLIYGVEGGAWEQVSFGIDSLGRSRSLLENAELRRALVSCVNREGLSRARLDAGSVVDDYSLPGSFGSAAEDDLIPYQPSEAGLILNDLGWIDRDGDPETPRISEGIEGIPDGTALQLTLLAAESQANSITIDFLKEGLENCGVGIDVETLPAEEMLAAGPEGPVFGRDFDLAYFAWASGHYQACRLFMSSEIPGIYPEFPKGWGGVNAAGYSNPEFDLGCQTLLTELPDSAAYQDAIVQTKEIFRLDMPVMPLFFRRNLIITSPEISGQESGYFNPFWNIEALR